MFEGISAAAATDVRDCDRPSDAIVEEGGRAGQHLAGLAPAAEMPEQQHDMP